MFQRWLTAWREVRDMNEETREDLVEKYTREVDWAASWARYEEEQLEYLHGLRRLRARVRLYLCRYNERVARADVERCKRL